MRFIVIDSRTVVYEERVRQVVLPVADGEISVLDFHEPFLYRLRPGLVRTDDAVTIKIEDGVARMQNNELVLLVEREQAEA